MHPDKQVRFPVHPDSTIESIATEISALPAVKGGLIDPFQVEVFEGTEVFQKLARENRLLGGPLLWHFWPQQPQAKRFAELFYRLRRDVFGRVQLTAYAVFRANQPSSQSRISG